MIKNKKINHIKIYKLLDHGQRAIKPIKTSRIRVKKVYSSSKLCLNITFGFFC